MAFVINDNCRCCGICAATCPCDAISMGDGKFEIDPAKCQNCGSCAMSCPADAIHEE